MKKIIIIIPIFNDWESLKQLLLEIDQVISWEVGSLMTWDRSRIHCSDNFLKSNVISKTCMALFTSKNKT